MITETETLEDPWDCCEQPEPAYCPICDTLNYPMGVLGKVTHYGCQFCGVHYHQREIEACPTPT